MNLTPREIDKLLIFVVAELADKRRKRGLKLNYGESVALISFAIMEAARDGKTVAECMELGKKVIGPDDVLPGVRGMLKLMQVEASFDDGTKLVSCHDPIGGK
ncbi:urease subunit gamma [Nonomuraea insulae]|uniref:Urease subunit gamma n=1 Tax=Nonomuraea insulae TaxID=1616787 RepID=A0ABW1CCM5_9ACTN